MMTTIASSYFSILISVGAASFCIFVMGLYLLLRSPAPREAIKKHASGEEAGIGFETSEQAKECPRFSAEIPDISTIAGDDVNATQLDLARAYIETGKKQRAHQILHSVLTQGSVAQQQEAQQLLNSI